MFVLTISELCSSGIHNLKIHPMSDHAVEDLREFILQSVLKASLLEQHSLHIKHAYRKSLKRTDTYTLETVSRMEG